MARRGTRILRRLAIAVAVLVGLGLAALTWLAYWPLEGSVDRIEQLVPEDVDFVYTGRFRDLRGNAWVRANLLEQPFLPDFAGLEETIDDRIGRSIRELEDRINASIPLGIVRFSVVEDVFPGPTIFCGRFCEGWGPERARPLWPKEFLLLTQTTWKPRWASVLKHGFVRKQMGGVEVTPGESSGVWKLRIPGIPVTRPEQRAGCGEGFVIPPEDEIWLVRVKNVLGFSNSKSLAHEVAELGRAGDSGRRSFADRPDFSLQPPPGGLAAAIDLRPVHGYFLRVLEGATGTGSSSQPGGPRAVGGPFAGLLNRFVSIRAMSKLNGTVETPSSDLLRASARILYEPKGLSAGLQEVYGQPPGDLRSGIARLVPASDTFAVLLLQTPPLYLMQSVWEEGLSTAQRELVIENLRNKGTYATMDEFFRELSERLGPRAAIAVARISDVFDRADYPEFFPDAEQNPDPFPAFAILVALRQTATPQEVDDFLAKSMPALGFKPEIQRVEYQGLTYSKLEIEQKTADYRLATPAYMLVQDTLILANNEDYFRKIVDTLKGAPALADDPTFKATMEALPERAQIGLFVDLSKVLRVPSDSDPKSMPRGFLWDRRNLWVIENRDPREEAIRYRRDQEQLAMQQRRGLSPQEQEEIEKRVDQHVETWMTRYPDFVEEYRRSLLDYRRLRSAGAAFAVTRDAITADLGLLVQPVEAAPAAP